MRGRGVRYKGNRHLRYLVAEILRVHELLEIVLSEGVEDIRVHPTLSDHLLVLADVLSEVLHHEGVLLHWEDVV